MKEVELFDHQKKAVKQLANGKILTGGVGSGKSHTALRYYIEKEAPKDVYVITTAKKRDSGDWPSEAFQHGIGVSRDATFQGVLTVDSWNNIGKYIDVEGAFFIFDEQRLVGSGAWVKSFLKIAKKNRWLLLSATPGDTWLDYIPVFIANGHYKNRTEFLREHVVYSRFSKFPKVDRFIAVGRLVRLRNSILVEMPFKRSTIRHIEMTPVEYDQYLFKRVTVDRWHVYEDRPLRDVAELFSVMRRVVNSDPSRVSHVIELLETYPRLIVFYNFDYELELLRGLKILRDGAKNPSPNTTQKYSDSELNETTNSLSTSGQSKTTGPGNGIRDFSIAEWNGHKHEPIPDTDSWVYLVQYTAGAEGWNCISTNATIFYSLTYSYRAFEQSQGRIDRLNTPFIDLYYYVLKSKSWIDKKVWHALCMKEEFNERKALEDLLR